MSNVTEDQVKLYLDRTVSPKTQVIFAKIMMQRTPIITKVLSSLVKGEISLQQLAALDDINEESIDALVSLPHAPFMVNGIETGSARAVLDLMRNTFLLEEMIDEYMMFPFDKEYISPSNLVFTANVEQYVNNGLAVYTDEVLFKEQFNEAVDSAFNELSMPRSFFDSYPINAAGLMPLFPNNASDLSAQTLFTKVYTSSIIAPLILATVQNKTIDITNAFVSYRENIAYMALNLNGLGIVNHAIPSRDFNELIEDVSLSFVKDPSITVERADLLMDSLLTMEFGTFLSEKLTLIKAYSLISKGIKQELGLPTLREDDYLESIVIFNNMLEPIISILTSISTNVRSRLSVL